MVTWLVAGVGTASLAITTDGYRAFTSEGARQLAVARSPRVLPDVVLEDQDGVEFRWADLQGSPTVVEFIYTTCPDICGQLLSSFRTMVASESARPASRVRFVSITFDPEHDTTSRLKAVAAQYGADGHRWRFARIEDRAALEQTLSAFEVVVLPVPDRGFVHNAAFYGVDERGRLARIEDIAEPLAILSWAGGRP